MSEVKTLRFRIKDKHAGILRRMAREVNTIWNYYNELSSRAIRERGVWMTGYDLQKYTNGYTKVEGTLLSSSTPAQVAEEYAQRRRQFKKARLNWRVSNRASSKYSLGWIPFKVRAARFIDGKVVFSKASFSIVDSYGLENYELRAGNLSEDSRGRWYLNVSVKNTAIPSAGTGVVGIDPGAKTAFTMSTGEVFEGRHYRTAEPRLAMAQRAKKKKLARTIAAKIKNQRKDALHKLSSRLVQENAAIFIGDVSPSKMVKTKFAKSTLDAGWSMFATMLDYKCRQAGVVFARIDEKHTTQTCFLCESIEGPKGVEGLRIRQWLCSCGSLNDRDVNAARNIARRGLATLGEGALS